MEKVEKIDPVFFLRFRTHSVAPWKKAIVGMYSSKKSGDSFFHPDCFLLNLKIENLSGEVKEIPQTVESPSTADQLLAGLVKVETN